MPVTLNSSGGGSVTLAAASTGSPFTATFPAVTGTVSLQASAGYTTGSVLFVNSSGQIAQNNSQLFWDNTNNYLGIGTASPGAKLDVQGGRSYFASNSDAFATYLRYNTSTAGVFVGSPSANAFQISASSGASYLNIDSSGNVLVGGTTSYSPVTVTKVASNANLGQICAAGLAAGDVGNAGISVCKFDNNTTTSQIFVKFLINGTAVGSGQINANGASTAAFGSYSDRRLKENIIDLPSQLSNILALRPREFDYIESEGGGHQIGFVAQEIQQVYPDVVGEREDGMLTVTAWSKTEARLVKAIQELSAKNDALEARIAALEAK